MERNLWQKLGIEWERSEEGTYRKNCGKNREQNGKEPMNMEETMARNWAETVKGMARTLWKKLEKEFVGTHGTNCEGMGRTRNGMVTFPVFSPHSSHSLHSILLGFVSLFSQFFLTPSPVSLLLCFVLFYLQKQTKISKPTLLIQEKPFHDDKLRQSSNSNDFIPMGRFYYFLMYIITRSLANVTECN